MSEPSQHPAIADILRFIDLEASPEQAESIREHLAHCPECRAYKARIESTSLDIENIYASSGSPDVIPSSAASRTRLQQQLSINRRPTPWWYRHIVCSQNAYRSGAVLLILAAIGLAINSRKRMNINHVLSPYVESGRRPNRSLTPGAVRLVTLSEICSSSDDDLDPAVSAPLKNEVLREYGISSGHSERTYQIDYLVNPQLGGTSDIKNLWPETYSGGVWNARAKDDLERHLHQMVCNRTVDLTVAQQAIATDWIAAYKKYIHQGAPA